MDTYDVDALNLVNTLISDRRIVELRQQIELLKKDNTELKTIHAEVIRDEQDEKHFKITVYGCIKLTTEFTHKYEYRYGFFNTLTKFRSDLTNNLVRRINIGAWGQTLVSGGDTCGITGTHYKIEIPKEVMIHIVDELIRLSQ